MYIISMVSISPMYRPMNGYVITDNNTATLVGLCCLYMDNMMATTNHIADMLCNILANALTLLTSNTAMPMAGMWTPFIVLLLYVPIAIDKIHALNSTAVAGYDAYCEMLDGVPFIIIIAIIVIIPNNRNKLISSAILSLFNTICNI